jgi:hypothetical protein
MWKNIIYWCDNASNNAWCTWRQSWANSISRQLHGIEGVFCYREEEGLAWSVLPSMADHARGSAVGCGHHMKQETKSQTRYSKQGRYIKMDVHLSKNSSTRAHCLVIICSSPHKITEKAILPSIILSSKKSMTILQKHLLAWLKKYECSLCEETLCTVKLYWNSILSICPSVVKCSSLKKSWVVHLSLFGLLFCHKFEAHILRWLATMVNPLVGIQFIQEGKGKSACYEYRVHI